MVFLACFQMGFLLCDHGLDFEIGLCENSINQNQSVLCDISSLNNRRLCRPWHTDDAMYTAYRTIHHYCIYDTIGQITLYYAMLCTTLWRFLLIKQGLNRAKHVPPTTSSKENLASSQFPEGIGHYTTCCWFHAKMPCTRIGDLLPLYFTVFTTTVGQQGSTLNTPEHYK